MNITTFRNGLALLAVLGLSACGGGEGGGGNSTVSADEVTNPSYDELSDRTAGGTGGLAYVVLEGSTARFNDDTTFTYRDGKISGGLLNNTDFDGSQYTNPANGEFSRVVRISGDNVFGVVGLDVQSGDMPTTGSTSYNAGWVGMNAIVDGETLVLTGDATFTAQWEGDTGVSGRFFNLSGTSDQSGNVTNVGTIVLTDADLNGGRFSGGRMTGTGSFSGLNAAGGENRSQGVFFGPDADEIGGVLDINDGSADIRVLGAFQAD